MRTHGPEVKAEARRLVVAEGASYAQVSAQLSVPKSTVQKWAARGGWQRERDTSLSYEATVRALKAKLLERALGALEGGGENAAQLVYAWKQAEAAYPEHRYVPHEADPELKRRIALEVVEALVEYLDGNDRNLLTAFRGHIRPFAESIEARYAA